jgi:predicted TIM-barrel fold metal-dependent hydrolase
MDHIKVCDPHFHIWNIHERPNPNLGPAVEQNLPAYLAADYLAEMAHLPAPLKLVSSVHVETVVGQMDGGHVIDTVGETRWVCDQIAPTEHPIGIVSYVHLARDTEESSVVLQQHEEAAGGRLRGVRMILNHHSDNPDLTWPQVERGDFLKDACFQEGIALLGEHNMSFDLQCNAHQYLDAAETFAAYPQAPVIVDHLGSYHDGEDETYEQMWREGMRTLAQVSHIHVKLSMLWFGRAGYHQDHEKEAKIKNLVRETIDMFGPDRCMFASNYPVDRIAGIDIPTLYGQFASWTADLPPADQASLFHDTAARVYRVGG